MRRKLFIVFCLAVLGLWFNNSNLFTRLDTNVEAKLLSHRGVHQYFDSQGVGNNDCTATLIEEPVHPFIENTIASMQAAFDAGAHIIELDIHLTPDGERAVFHDWTLECRTNGNGTTHKTPMPELKKLDIGFGYTADGGITYPLRGTGVGHMPTLSEVLRHFTDGAFLVNLKSNNAGDGKAFAEFLSMHPEWKPRIWGVYGGPKSVAPVKAAYPSLKSYSRKSLKSCLKSYAAMGWSGIAPKQCRNTAVSVPSNYGKFLWGWPTKFEKRMNEAGSTVILLGPHAKGNSGTTGIDSLDQLDMIPDGFNGYIWTNRVEVLGPALKPRKK